MKVITFVLTLLLILAPIASLGRKAHASVFLEHLNNARFETAPVFFCPIPEKIENICMFVDGRNLEPDAEWRKTFGDYVYRYQRKILDAACVIGKDEESTVNKKVQTMWTASRDKLNCLSIQFDASGGNILKFAISSKFDQFIHDAIWWGVDLNWVDEIDKRTVLDYVSYEIEKHKGTNIESKYAHYYKLLRDAGAKHRHELKTQK